MAARLQRARRHRSLSPTCETELRHRANTFRIWYNIPDDRPRSPDVRDGTGRPPMTVRAAVCHAFGEPLSSRRSRSRGPGRGELRVEVAACAICQSDIHLAKGAWGGRLPAVYGHEAAGIVAEVGDGVEGFEVGDHVVVTLIRSCGSCDSCARDEFVLCTATFPLDTNGPLHSLDGAADRSGPAHRRVRRAGRGPRFTGCRDSRRYPPRQRRTARVRRDHRIRGDRQHGAGRAGKQRGRDRHGWRRPQRGAGCRPGRSDHRDRARSCGGKARNRAQLRCHAHGRPDCRRRGRHRHRA